MATTRKSSSARGAPSDAISLLKAGAEAKKSGMDLGALGEQLLARKRELQSRSKAA